MWIVSSLLFAAGSLCVAAFMLYPVAMAVAASAGRRKDDCGHVEKISPVTVLIAARNAESMIRKKLENTLSQDYPESLLDVVVVSDGSIDRTAAIARRFDKKKVRVLEIPEHRGKIAALNAGLPLCTGQIVVFTDVDAELVPGAVSELVSAMSRDRAAGVCGKRVVRSAGRGFKGAQRSYFKMDVMLKQWESALGSVTSNDGKLYAVKREYLSPFAEAVTDDLYQCIQVVLKGGRFTFEPGATAWVPTPSRDHAHELSRRRRIVGQSLRCMSLCRDIFDFRKHGWHAARLFVNKVLRRLFPFAAAAVFIGAFGLCRFHWLFALVSWLPAAVFCMVFSTWFFAPVRVREKLSPILYFATAMLATALGVIDFLRGNIVAKWDPVKEPG